MRNTLLGGLFFAILSLSCDEPKAKKVLSYEGPMLEMNDVETDYTENNRITARLVAPIVQQFLNEDMEYPKGIYVKTYNELGELESTVKADEAHFFKSENKWRARGNVILKNLLKNQMLTTEELFWDRKTKKMYTDKFVTINDTESIIYGNGLEANQDFSEYNIHKVTGEIMLNE